MYRLVLVIGTMSAHLQVYNEKLSIKEDKKEARNTNRDVGNTMGTLAMI